MHVFICWSGRRSRRVAETIAAQWLPGILGTSVTSFVSFSDIEKGEGWFDRLMVELSKADAAVICLTPENLASPWLHFESGMVSRFGRGSVFTYFLGADAAAIQDPLKQIQVTLSTHADTRLLALRLAELSQVSPADLAERWPTAWDSLEAVLKEIGAPGMEDFYPGFGRMFDRKTFDERLEECDDQFWLKRFEGAHDTVRALTQRLELVGRICEPWQIWLYEKLIHQVDGYVDQIKRYLLIEREFDVSPRQVLDFSRSREARPRDVPPGLSAMCDRRCREIRHLLFCLMRPDAGAPVLPESLAFAQLRPDQFDDKKDMVHARGLKVTRAGLGLRTDADLERCARSVWDYDRIMSYKAMEAEPIAVATMIGRVEQEFEKAQADDDEPSLMPLHYSVKAFVQAMHSTPERVDSHDVLRLVAEIQEFLQASGPVAHPKLRRNLAEIREIVDRPQVT